MDSGMTRYTINEIDFMREMLGEIAMIKRRFKNEKTDFDDAIERQLLTLLMSGIGPKDVHQQYLSVLEHFEDYLPDKFRPEVYNAEYERMKAERVGQEIAKWKARAALLGIELPGKGEA